MGSLSLTVDYSIPCNLNIYSTKLSAIDFVENGLERGIKCSNFVNFLMATMIVSLPLELGSTSIKSNEISSHTYPGIGRS